MTSMCKLTEPETRPLQDAIDEDKRLENKMKNLPKSETHVFEMPNIENGVTNIGDLWDCRRSQSARLNLLNTSEFTAAMLHASPINKCDTKFRQIRSHEDKIESLHIDGKMSLEFLLGTIKLEGQSNYDNSTSSERFVEGILYNYLNEQYKIQLIPPIRPALLNRYVKNMLQSGKIKATHVVGGMIIGAEVTAWIEVMDKKSKKEVKKDGKASGACAEGVLKFLSSLSGGAQVITSDAANEGNHEVKVSVTAKPEVEHSPRPTSLEEFLPFIRNLSKDLTKHILYPHINSNIFGVPIRYILYPISQFVDLEMETLYRELTDACQENFVGVIAKCNDLRQAGYIWKIILERNQQLNFLQDSKSEFSKKVDNYEKEIRELAQDVLRRSRKALSDYKSGESDIDEIENIVHEFYKSKAGSAQEKAKHMADEGTKELQRAYFDATDEGLQSRVKRITDRNECDIWLGMANPRLLLEIKPPCSEVIVKSFLDAAENLINLEVGVTIAMPSISEGVCLTLKCNERKEKLEGLELSRALEVLNAVVVEGYSSIHTFYKILGSLCTIGIPLCHVDISYLDKILQMLLSETYCQNRAREVCFVRSLCDLATELRLHRKVICLPLGAPDTDLAVVKQFRSLAKQDAFSDFKWIFCNFDVNNYQEAPLLLIFVQSEIVAVCLDNLDILILTGIMNSKSDESRSNFDILKLTPTRFANTLYPERAHCTLEIMSRINSGIRLSSSKISGFQDDLHEESLNHLMIVIRATLHNDIVDLASAVAAMVTGTFPSLRITLEKIGWREIEKKFDSVHFERENGAYYELMGELEKWMNEHSFEAIVQETQQQLVELQSVLVDDSDINFNEAVRRIMNDDLCPSVVRTQLSKVKSSRQSLKAKCTEVSNILNSDMLKETLEVGCGHIKAFITVLQKSSQKKLSPETIGGELVYLYSRRSTTVIENAMIENEITRFLKPYQPYHMLNTLQPVKHGQALMFLYEALGELDSLDNSSAVAEITSKAYDELNKANSEVLWNNEQWLCLVRHCLNNHNNKELIDSLSKWMTNISETGPIPADIVDIHQRSSARKEVASGNRTAKLSDDVIGHEYSFQACGEMYHIALGENLKSEDLQGKLTQRFAENLIAGKAIELVNGDSREIPLAFFSSICKTVSQIRPGIRVFVMTLFELRMSQRSSLLNALLSCKYASSVERHNIRSLFMRMILLDDSVLKAYGYDAIIVLNTESFRSQEVLTSYTKGREDLSRDWLLTIFAISLSNLAVIDEALFNGQQIGFERVTEVLARLRQVSILPDLLISRTFNDRTSPIEASSKIVEKTIRTQIDRFSSKGDTYADYAHQLKNKLESGKIYLNVSYLDSSIIDKNQNTCETMQEDVTNLCQSLLSRANSGGQKITFEYWSQLLHSSWNCLKEPQYWLRLRESLDFHELAYFGKQFATAKELLTRTFLIHRKTISKQVREKHSEEFSAIEICQQLETIPSHCHLNCGSCRKTVSYREKLYLDVKDTAWQDIIRISFQNHRKSVSESIKKLIEMDIKELHSKQSIAQNLSKQITIELQKIRTEWPRGIFNSVQTNVQVEEIWTKLLTISAEDEDDPTEEEQFARVVNELFPERDGSGFTYDLLMAEFKNSRSVGVTELEEADLISQTVIEDETTPLTAPKMSQIITRCQAIASELQAETTVLRQVCFNKLQIFRLSNEINRVMLKFLTVKRFDCSQAGIKFERVMANEFHDHTVSILGMFEAKFKLSISDNLKNLLQIYILKIFYDRVIALQKKWNSNNVALSILTQGETDYKAQISTRLASGFSSHAEGKLAARYLIMLIRQMAIKDEYDARISSFLSIPWVANSETVRLRYFETLALEVAAEKKEKTLEHLKNPQASITKWYKDTAHNYRSENVQKLFSSALYKCLQEIRDCKDYSDIDNILTRYATFASSIYKYERFQTEGDDFESMLNSLKSDLAQYSPFDDFETLPDIWENSEVRFRLGCTEECFRCGALCWNYFGHSDDEGDLSKHYSCHQARGLATTSAGENMELLASPCSQVSSLGAVKGMVTLSECCGDLPSMSRRSVSWKEIETDHLGDWKFQKNIPSKYDDLMRWFFQELHVDIAREKKLRSPSEWTLKEFGYLNLKLPNILIALRNEIN